MRKVAVAVTFTLLALWASPADGRMQPSFILDSTAWYSTDIVVVTEGGEVDGKVTVINAWKGEIPVGSALVIPELAQFAPEEKRTVGLGSVWYPSRVPDGGLVVTGDCMVLFLTRPETNGEDVSAPVDDMRARHWLPGARIGDFTTSVVWVEDGNAYDYMQRMNPGPSFLGKDRRSFDQMRERVREICRAQEELEQIALVADADTRVERAAEFVHSSVGEAGRQALDILKGAGEPAHGVLIEMFRESDNPWFQSRLLKVLCETGGLERILPEVVEILRDDSQIEKHSPLISGLVDSGDKSLGPIMIEIVEEELEFWREVGPSLPKKWSRDPDLTQEEKKFLSAHNNRAIGALYALQRVRTEASRRIATEYRDLWLSLDNLLVPYGGNQPAEAAESVLWDLDNPPAGDD